MSRGSAGWPTEGEVRKRADDELAKLYAEAAVTATDQIDIPSMQNAAADCIATIYRELRSRGLASQRRLVTLLTHPHPGVRSWAAAHALEFDPTAGEPVLVELTETDLPLHAFGAKMTLREWRAGRLRFP